MWNTGQRRFCSCFVAWCLVWSGSAVAAVAQEVPAGPQEPQIAQASAEAERAIARFRLPPGWQGHVFAAEPQVANPVAFALDHAGRVYVCESFRQNQGVTDNRGHDERWLNADLAAQTVADRIRYHRELLGAAAADYTKHDDRLRLLEVFSFAPCGGFLSF